MRKKIQLYIEGYEADIKDDGFLLYNWTLEDLTDPTAVKNSFSQSVTLPGTKRNNEIFGNLWRLDDNHQYVTGGGAGLDFVARYRQEFKIYDEYGAILVSGYVKLDSIKVEEKGIEYSVTLYGGLGSFLYGLTYNDDGDKKTLADLHYTSGTSETEFNFTINRSTLTTAWSALPGQSVIEMWSYINFMPNYGGYPDNFDANCAVFDGALYDHSFNVLKATLSRSFQGNEMKDMRSWLQRPIIKVSKVLDAIAASANNGGWAVEYPTGMSSDPYIRDTWMTLPLMDKEVDGLRSGASYTKADILAATMTPAEFLLSVAKMMNWFIDCDLSTKKVVIRTKAMFFSGATVDAEAIADKKKGTAITPLVMDTRWYEMKQEMQGEFCISYESNYGRVFGSQRIDTGYDFNSEVKDITENILFKGAASVKETSLCYRDAWRFNVYEQDFEDFPACFLEGGTYQYTVGDSTDTYNLIDNRKYSFQWWDTVKNGRDLYDWLQLHDSEGKPTDGSGILVFFDGMTTTDKYHASDDVASMGTPCWNICTPYTYEGNVTALTAIPHFSRFQYDNQGAIIRSLDWGRAKELLLDAEYAEETAITLYERNWRAMLLDQYDINSEKMTAWLNLEGMNADSSLLRKFYWFGGVWWILTAIKNHSLTTYDLTECEFLKVNDKTNYTI